MYIHRILMPSFTKTNILLIAYVYTYTYIPLIPPILFSPATYEHFFAALTSPHLNLIEFVCAANCSPNDTLIQPVKGDECLHALAAQSMLVIIFLIWCIPPHPALPSNEIISHFDN